MRWTWTTKAAVTTTKTTTLRCCQQTVKKYKNWIKFLSHFTVKTTTNDDDGNYDDDDIIIVYSNSNLNVCKRYNSRKYITTMTTTKIITPQSHTHHTFQSKYLNPNAGFHTFISHNHHQRPANQPTDHR